MVIINKPGHTPEHVSTVSDKLVSSDRFHRSKNGRREANKQEIMYNMPK